MNLNKMKIGETQILAAKEMSSEDFAEQLMDSGFWSDVFSDMFHGRHFSSDKCVEILEKEAKHRNIKLTDAGDWDGYDKWFYEAYKADDDKGLS